MVHGSAVRPALAGKSGRLPGARLVAVLVLGLAAACATYAPASFDTVGPAYVTGGGIWNTGGGISAVVRVKQQDGATLVCGAWATDRQSTLSIEYNEQVMQAASVFIAGRRLAHGLGFMQRVRGADNISGAEARCVVSGLPWQPDFATAEPELRFPLMAWRENGDRGPFGFASGYRVVFRQTPRADIAR